MLILISLQLYIRSASWLQVRSSEGSIANLGAVMVNRKSNENPTPRYLATTLQPTAGQDNNRPQSYTQSVLDWNQQAMEANACDLHLKGFPALASIASQFQSNTVNTRLVYCWKKSHVFLLGMAGKAFFTSRLEEQSNIYHKLFVGCGILAD